MALLIVAALIRIFVIPRFKTIPGKVQSVIEKAVEYFDDLAKKSPHKRAREWMHRPAYQSEKLSYQARLMIRKQGKQTKHLEADEYVRRRELK